MRAIATSRTTRTAAALAALALVLAGCGGTSTPAAAGGAATSASSSSTTGTEVKVGMTEYALTLSQQTFTPGTYTFTTTNNGKFPHTITINGPGVENKTAGGPSKPGQSGTLTVDLKAGTYQIWCPVGNHRSQGMQTTITVA